MDGIEVVEPLAVTETAVELEPLETGNELDGAVIPLFKLLSALTNCGLEPNDEPLLKPRVF